MTHAPRDPEEVPELSRLSKEASPDADVEDLEDRVVDALKQAGLVSTRVERRRAPMIRVAAAAVAAAALVTTGWVFGRSSRPEPAPDLRPSFVLFLREGPAYAVGGATSTEERRVEEYREWARKLRDEGIRISGEKLTDDVRRLRKPGDASSRTHTSEDDLGNLSGFFLIEPTDLEEALRIANDCPHLRYGGTIEVRAIDPV